MSGKRPYEKPRLGTTPAEVRANKDGELALYLDVPLTAKAGRKVPRWQAGQLNPPSPYLGVDAEKSFLILRCPNCDKLLSFEFAKVEPVLGALLNCDGCEDTVIIPGRMRDGVIERSYWVHGCVRVRFDELTTWYVQHPAYLGQLAKNDLGMFEGYGFWLKCAACSHWFKQSVLGSHVLRHGLGRKLLELHHSQSKKDTEALEAGRCPLCGGEEGLAIMVNIPDAVTERFTFYEPADIGKLRSSGGDVFTSEGGILDLDICSPAVREILEQDRSRVQDLFETLIAVEPMRVKSVRVVIVNNWTVNMVVTREDDHYWVGIYAGLSFALINLFTALLADADIFSGVGSVNPQSRQVQPPKLCIDYRRLLLMPEKIAMPEIFQYMPVDPVRRELVSSLLTTAWLFIATHELGHVLRGHLLMEKHAALKEREQAKTHRQQRALELDADDFASHLLFHKTPLPAIEGYGSDAMHLRCLLFAVGMTMLLLTDPKRSFFGKRLYPPPEARFAMVSFTLKKEAEQRGIPGANEAVRDALHDIARAPRSLDRDIGSFIGPGYFLLDGEESPAADLRMADLLRATIRVKKFIGEYAQFRPVIERAAARMRK